MAQEQFYRVTTFFRKRPDLSEEQFYHHWGKVHGPLVIPWALKHGVLEYTQYQTPSELRALFASQMDTTFRGSIEFDAAAVWHVKSYEAWTAAFSDPYYVNVIEPDERNFVDKGQGDSTSDKPGKMTVVRAMNTLGTYRYMIKDGKPAIEVTDEILEKWKPYGGGSSTS